MNRNAPTVPTTRHVGLGQASVFEEAFDNFARVVDQYVPGARGEIAHEYLLRNGYFSDPERADRIYNQNPAVDEYLDHIQVSQSTGAGGSRGLTGAQVTAAAIGFGLGLATAYFTSNLSKATTQAGT